MTQSHTPSKTSPPNVDALLERWLRAAHVEMEGQEIHKLPYPTTELIPSLMGFGLYLKEAFGGMVSVGARAALLREIEREGYTKNIAHELIELVTVVMHLDTWHLRCTGSAFSADSAGELEASKDLLLAVAALRATAISQALARAKILFPELS